MTGLAIEATINGVTTTVYPTPDAPTVVVAINPNQIVEPAAPVIMSSSPLPAATQNTPYSYTFTASGGLAPYTWTAGGDLPAGLSLSSAGVLSGVPLRVPSARFTVNLYDSLGRGTTGTFSLTISGPGDTLTVSTSSPLPPAIQNHAYVGATIAATGGTGPYTFSVNAGSSLPTGLSLSSAGALTGTPTGLGTFSFTLKVTDSTAATATKAFTLVATANFGALFNDWVHSKTSGSGGDYPDGDVWMPAGTYRVNPIDLGASAGYVRAYNAGKPNGNWLKFREYDGPGTVVFDLRPESAASALGQTQTQAYNDTTTGGSFRNVAGTVGSVRWCFDGGFIFQNGSVHATANPADGGPGIDRLIFHGTTHKFPVAEWRRQFDIIYTLRTGSAPATYIPNDSPAWRGLGGNGPDDGGPYWQTYANDSRFKGANEPSPFRLESTSHVSILRADIGPAGDDGIYNGRPEYLNVVGCWIHEVGNINGSVLGLGSAWFHPDILQIVGPALHCNLLDTTYHGHLNVAAEGGSGFTNLVVDRIWEGMCGIVGGVVYRTGGRTMANTSFGTGAPTTRLSGNYFKGFGNGTEHNDGGTQVGYMSGANGWHAVLEDDGGTTASFNVTLAVPSGVTVNPTTGFATSGIESFRDSPDVPHQLFRAAYAVTELSSVMADYGISFD